MSYNSWKLMDKIDIAVKTDPSNKSFSGFIVESGDKKALESAKSWALEREWDREKKEYTIIYEPKVYTFENKGFTATILDCAGGSSQGGRLSFWQCSIEKDGVKVIIGVNDAVLADLIKNSDISNGVVQQKVMFVRKAGQPGLIHEDMDAYTEAVADMKQKSDLKSAKKTTKWEIGGVYSSLTQTDICLGEIYDTMEEYQEKNDSYYSWGRTITKLRKREEPVKVIAWMHWYNFSKDKIMPETFGQHLREELESGHIYFSTGKPPARAKASQYKVKNSDLKLIDKILSKREDSINYADPKITGRFIREIK